MPEDTVSDFEIADVENYGGSSDQNYSRSMLLMRATGRVLEAGSREMKKGFYIVKKDKFGNVIRSLTDDTRKAYCESVQTLRDLQTCDLTSDEKTKVEKIDDDIEKYRRKLIVEEFEEFKNLSKVSQQSLIARGLGVVIGSFNSEKRFHEQFILYSLQKHRELFQLLISHSKERDWYGEQIFEA